MATLAKDFYGFVAQTSKTPIGLEIASAKGLWLTDVKGEKYLDLISGIAVSNLGGSPQFTFKEPLAYPSSGSGYAFNNGEKFILMLCVLAIGS